MVLVGRVGVCCRAGGYCPCVLSGPADRQLVVWAGGAGSHCCGRAQRQLLRIVRTCWCVLLRCFRQGQVTESLLLKHSFLLAQLCLQNFICYQLVFINNTFSLPFRRTLSNSGLYPPSLASFQKSVFPGIVFFFFWLVGNIFLWLADNSMSLDNSF